MEKQHKNELQDTMARLQGEIHRLNKENGFWETELTTAGKIALIHSEISEALEADREGNLLEEDGVAEELADAVIRILDLSEHLRINLAKQVLQKHKKNKSREHKHGKKY